MNPRPGWPAAVTYVEGYTAFRMRLDEASGIGTLTRATSIWKYQVLIGTFPSAHVHVQRRPLKFLH